MDQRLFIAIALSMLVMIGYYALFPPQQPTPEQTTQQSEPGKETVTPPAAGESPTVATTPTAPVAPDGMQAATPVDESAPNRTIEVITPLYTAHFETRGGRLTLMELSDYRNQKASIDWGDIIPPLEQYVGQDPVDEFALVNMVPPTDGDGVTPFELQFVGEESMTRRLRRTGFEPDKERIELKSATAAPETLTLTARTRDGLTIRKTFTFRPDAYRIDYTMEVMNYGESPRILRLASLFGEGPEGARENQGFGAHIGPIWMEDGSVETEDADDVGASLLVRNPLWMGIAETYFLTVAESETPFSHGFFRAREVREGDDSIWISTYGYELPQVELNPGNMVSAKFKTYMGPKQVDHLTAFGSSLEESVTLPALAAFLRLDVLAWPMLALLRWFYSFTGNYGVAIILLTILVRVAIFPITYKGSLAMKRMQKLQPRMKALRDKYKDNKEKLNQEMIGLYRRHKVNPLGGCLPILLQLPVFLALYSALLIAIELRHEPFIFWIHDLSAMDGLYILPLLMGGSMLVQQRMMPTSLDPTQAKIMMWMPVMFMFFMLSFPSGLVLYWFVSNILSIGQQAVINRIKVPEPEE